jgi:hypothetical protein
MREPGTAAAVPGSLSEGRRGACATGRFSSFRFAGEVLSGLLHVLFDALEEPFPVARFQQIQKVLVLL